MTTMDQIKDVCRRVEDLCATEGRPRFDRIRLMSDPDELWFIWEDPKQVIVVELSDDPGALLAPLTHAAGGDAVLN